MTGSPGGPSRSGLRVRTLAVMSFFSLMFFGLLPGTVLLAARTPIRFDWNPVTLAGAALACVSGVSIVGLVRQLVREGHGTPAPIAPPAQLVRRGAYQRVRNPMYLAYLGFVVGEALLLQSAWLGVYAAGLAGLAHAYVVRREEPWLEDRFGDDYRGYCREVPRWWPSSRAREARG